MYAEFSTLYGNTYGCAENNRRATALSLMSMLSQDFSVIIHFDKSSSRHGREVEDGLNSMDKRFIFQLI